MRKAAYKATVLGLVGNSALFVLKIIFGLLTNSIALISDAINSFTDIVASVAIFISVKISAKKADIAHPFGHYRAEPIAGLIVAILAGILGFEIIKISFERIIKGDQIVLSVWPIIILLISILAKVFMAYHFKKVGKKLNSPAILASAVDCRNDVFVSVAALIGIGGAFLNYKFLDPLAAFFIGGWIIKSGYEIGRENIDYLIGRAPSKEMIRLIEKKAVSIKKVKEVHDIRAHYVGNFLHVEVHICLNKRLNTAQSHSIGKKVEKAVESIDLVNKAFIHIDPY